MKRKGSSIIFVNDEGQILLFLRDNKPELPYSNMWDVPGGHVEADENPQNTLQKQKNPTNLNHKYFPNNLAYLLIHDLNKANSPIDHIHGHRTALHHLNNQLRILENQ